MMATSGSEDSEGLDLSDVPEETAKVTEKEHLLKTLKDMAKYLEKVSLCNDSCMVNARKPLDDLAKSFKFYPVKDRPSFSILPPEIKTDILQRLSILDKIIVATVCDEWRDLVKPELDRMHEIRIETERCRVWNRSKFRSSEYPCPPTRTNQLLESIAALKLNIKLSLFHVPKEMDFRLLTKALGCVSQFSLIMKVIEREGEITFPEIEMKVLFEATNREDIKLDLLGIFQVDWRNIMSADDLCTMVGNANIKRVRLSGSFTQEQVEAVKSIPQTVCHINNYGNGVVCFDREDQL